MSATHNWVRNINSKIIIIYLIFNRWHHIRINVDYGNNCGCTSLRTAVGTQLGLLCLMNRKRGLRKAISNIDFMVVVSWNLPWIYTGYLFNSQVLKRALLNKVIFHPFSSSNYFRLKFCFNGKRRHGICLYIIYNYMLRNDFRRTNFVINYLQQCITCPITSLLSIQSETLVFQIRWLHSFRRLRQPSFSWWWTLDDLLCYNKDRCNIPPCRQ